MSAFLQDSRSRPSPFCEYQGFRTFRLRRITFWLMSGCRFQAGEFWKVGPSSSTLLHSIRLTMTGRRKSLTDAYCSFVVKCVGTLKLLPGVSPFFEFSDGYHILPSSLSTPPEFTRLFHCASVILLFFTGRQASPEPSNVPEPVIAMFSRFLPEIGDWQRKVSNPSKLVFTSG